MKTKWGQKEPFNTYTPNTYPAGCVAVACAQIMQYCRKPDNPVFWGVNCSWSTMGTVCNVSDVSGTFESPEAKDQVARFLAHIGQKSLCYIRYGESESGAYADGVVRTLKHYGYSSVKKYLGFGEKNQKKASSMLWSGLPVYLDGSDHKSGKGHAWVIDGEWNGYFHCNWGWYGDWDGYYAKHNYFPVDYREYVDSTDPNTTNEINSIYDWNFRLVTYSK